MHAACTSTYQHTWPLVGWWHGRCARGCGLSCIELFVYVLYIYILAFLSICLPVRKGTRSCMHVVEPSLRTGLRMCTSFRIACSCRHVQAVGNRGFGYDSNQRPQAQKPAANSQRRFLVWVAHAALNQATQKSTATLPLCFEVQPLLLFTNCFHLLNKPCRLQGLCLIEPRFVEVWRAALYGQEPSVSWPTFSSSSSRAGSSRYESL